MIAGALCYTRTFFAYTGSYGLGFVAVRLRYSGQAYRAPPYASPPHALTNRNELLLLLHCSAVTVTRPPGTVMRQQCVCARERVRVCGPFNINTISYSVCVLLLTQ